MIYATYNPQASMDAESRLMTEALTAKAREKAFELALNQIALFNWPDPHMTAEQERDLLIKIATDALLANLK